MSTPDVTSDRAGSYDGFGGRVGRTMAGSDPWWPSRPVPPEGAPNVVVVLADDLGYSDLGCYGSEIATPHLDRLAAEGLRYTDFHVTPMCSPTRAALLTGVNAHRAGVGHVANSDVGFPGYAMELGDDVATTAEILGAAGYTTHMVGKWHLSKDADLNEAGSIRSWPVQRGFQRYFGFLDAFTNLHQPHRLYRDNQVVDVDAYPDDYYLTDQLTEEALAMVRAAKAADPSRPFFLYFAHGAVHAPLQARPADIARHRGAYDAGWDAIRAARHQRQIELGVVADGTRLPERNQEPGYEVAAWDELSADERRLFARHMEIYAAMVQTVDDSVGRIRAALEELGEWDNTILLFTSDNGASKEGEATGTSAYFKALLDWATKAEHHHVDTDLSRLDLLGGPRSLSHYPRGWAMASNTPFRLYKTTTHTGGHTVPLILSWPAGIAADQAGGLRRQYTHVTDVLPTLLDLTGVRRPAHRAGRPLEPLAGTSFAPTLTDVAAPSVHLEQHYELAGSRALYRDGWEVVALHQPLTRFDDDEYELFDHVADPTQVDDLAQKRPDLVAELAQAWEEAARANWVYPLDEGSSLKFVQRPAREEVYEQPVRIVPGTPTLERYRSQRLIASRSFTVTVDVDVDVGDRGVLVAHGDQGGGYVLYVEDGHLRFAQNGYGAMHELDGGQLASGRHAVVLEVTAPGGFRWEVALVVDGQAVAAGEDLPMLMAMAPFEGIDIGIDRRSPVSWDLYERHGPFPFSGCLYSVTYTPGDPAPEHPSAVLDVLRQIGAHFE